MMQHLFGGVEVSPDTLAFDSIKEIGPGGHHFGTEHTKARYPNEIYRPVPGDRLSIGQWEDAARLDAAPHATRVWKALLRNYDQPPIARGTAQELREYAPRPTRNLTYPTRARAAGAPIRRARP